MFIVYVNDMVEGVEIYMNLFAEDSKITKKIEKDSCGKLQEDLNRIYRWIQDWEMKFNIKKNVT